MEKQKITVNIPAQSFQIDVDVSTPLVTPPVVVDPPVITPPVIADGFKIGVNGFPWFPLSILQGIGMKWKRCYFGSAWGWQPGGLFVQPMAQAWTQETNGLDDYLIRAKAMGVEVLLCNHQTPEWYRPTGRKDGNNDYAPCKAGSDRTAPISFKDYAAYLFQIAARYGATNHDNSVLRVDTTSQYPNQPTNVKKSGLHLLKYMECWNEEKWWLRGTEAYLEPEVMAALMSACYDGHEGALGAGAGIKTADPSMIVVMPGLTDFDFEGIQKMDDWFNANRKDKKWPCDIANLHHYNNLGNKPKQHPAQWVKSGACLPKDDKNFDSIVGIVKYFADRNLKVWITETGADTGPDSNMQAAATPDSTNEKFQGQIIIESIKAYRAAGVDAVFIFTGPDDIGAADGGQFETSGIWTSQATGYKPKAAVKMVQQYLSESKQAASKAAAAPPPQIKASSFKRPA